LKSSFVKSAHSKKTDTKSDSLSCRLYGLDWNKHFPLALNDDIEVRVGTPHRGLKFYKQHYREIFNPDDNLLLLKSKTESARITYYSEIGDFFEIYHEQNLIGIFIGTPIDWSSYYFRSCGILPAYQGRKIATRLYAYLVEVIKKYPIERIEADVSPSNPCSMHMFNKLRFVVNGMKLSERWGGIVQFTKILSSEHEKVFEQQLCFYRKP
jgi:ribosomal protein S18 acetylase RimI-like enzyme